MSMKIGFLFVLLSLIPLTLSGLRASPETGDQAPPFRLQGSDGRTYALSDFVGKTPVVIAWFPKAFTGG